MHNQNKIDLRKAEMTGRPSTDRAVKTENVNNARRASAWLGGLVCDEMKMDFGETNADHQEGGRVLIGGSPPDQEIRKDLIVRLRFWKCLRLMNLRRRLWKSCNDHSIILQVRMTEFVFCESASHVVVCENEVQHLWGSHQCSCSHGRPLMAQQRKIDWCHSSTQLSAVNIQWSTQSTRDDVFFLLEFLTTKFVSSPAIPIHESWWLLLV